MGSAIGAYVTHSKSGVSDIEPRNYEMPEYLGEDEHVEKSELVCELFNAVCTTSTVVDPAQAKMFAQNELMCVSGGADISFAEGMLVAQSMSEQNMCNIMFRLVMMLLDMPPGEDVCVDDLQPDCSFVSLDNEGSAIANSITGGCVEVSVSAYTEEQIGLILLGAHGWLGSASNRVRRYDMPEDEVNISGLECDVRKYYSVKMGRTEFCEEIVNLANDLCCFNDLKRVLPYACMLWGIKTVGEEFELPWDRSKGMFLTRNRMSTVSNTNVPFLWNPNLRMKSRMLGGYVCELAEQTRQMQYAAVHKENTSMDKYEAHRYTTQYRFTLLNKSVMEPYINQYCGFWSTSLADFLWESINEDKPASIAMSFVHGKVLSGTYIEQVASGALVHQKAVECLKNYANDSDVEAELFQKTSEICIGNAILRGSALNVGGYTNMLDYVRHSGQKIMLDVKYLAKGGSRINMEIKAIVDVLDVALGSITINPVVKHEKIIMELDNTEETLLLRGAAETVVHRQLEPICQVSKEVESIYVSKAVDEC